MRLAREAPSVLKLRILKFRGEVGRVAIFAFEGSSDKQVFSRWITRISPTKQYEPFICNGKRECRALSHLIKDDLGNLGLIYIFVDRDFDGRDGFSDIDGIFVTDRHSIESYMIDKSHLDRILRDDLGCHGNPKLRKRISDTFDKDLDVFISSISAINFRLYLASKCRISRLGKAPERIDHFVEFGLGVVTQKSYSAPDLLPLESEPTRAASHMLADSFRKLDGRKRFRGKYILKFFVRWMQELNSDLRSTDSKFVNAEQAIEHSQGFDGSLMNLSARSSMPRGLKGFINSI